MKINDINNLPNDINVNRSFFLSMEDEVYFRIVTCDNLYKGLRKQFSYLSEGYLFHPAYRAGQWDGRVSLIKRGKAQNDPILMPIGLFEQFKAYVQSKGFEYHTTFDESDLTYASYTDSEVEERCSNYFKEGFKLRDYQISPIRIALNTGRAVFEIGTGGGKSATQYAMIRCMMEELPEDMNILMVIPNIMLIDQIFNDFKDYGWTDIEEHVDQLHGKTSSRVRFNKRILISTWQSLQNKGVEFFDRYGALMVDECFHEDTLILMADGSLKRISDVQVGDLVLSYNEETKTFEQNSVLNVFQNLKKSNDSKMLELVMDNGSVMKVTENHLFMTQRGWVSAGELTSEDEILEVENAKD